MSRFLQLKSAKPAFTLLLVMPALFLLSGCIGRPDVAPGGSCGSEGETKPSDDGCNTCTCSDGGWACTEKGCVEACKSGATKPADDGCNTCTCSDGGWACTLLLCPPPEDECFDGQEKPAGDGCNTCSCSKGTWLCTRSACIAPECKSGEVNDDGCNSCKCTDGSWTCTDVYCPEECSDGDTRSDGCNACICANGLWACTKQACETTGCGARLGDTCSDDEYCAYEEGQICGGADASAVCLPRPETCPTVDEPVCGCDGKEYSNSCLAAQGGTGVYQSGSCD